MTYSVNGKQYIIVAVSGGNYSGGYLAFSLPDSRDPAVDAGARRGNVGKRYWVSGDRG